jgi:type I restriction enzyme S subunit
VGIHHLGAAKLSGWPIPIAPLAAQKRIVSELDAHLACLHIADAAIASAERKLQTLIKLIIIEGVPVPGPDHWQLIKVADAGRVDLGRQRHPDWHIGPHMRPYLRVANVFENRIDTSDVMEMNFPPETFERFRLADGDILLNEGQSPEYLGRPAMYRGVPEEIAFTNSLLRFRARSDVDPEWALLVFRRHMHSGRFMQETRITTNIAHLSAARFKSVEFPIPPLTEQRAIVRDVHQKVAEVERLAEHLHDLQDHSADLRRRLLADAFRGRLVHPEADEEPAACLLERIKAERAVATRRRSAPPADRQTGTSDTSVNSDDPQKIGEVLSEASLTVRASRSGKQESLFDQEEVSS